MQAGPGAGTGLERQAMSTTARVANTRLRMLMQEARCTGQALARQVNATAAEVGVVLHYDRTSVAHWLTGTRPPKHVADFVAEALSRLLGRPITAADVGLRDADGNIPDRHPSGGADRLENLFPRGRDRRAAQHPEAYSLTSPPAPPFAVAAVSPEWAAVGLDFADGPSAAGGPGSGRVGTAQVAAAGLMVRIFSDTDLACGGGRARPALTAYLATDVAGWLRAPASPAVRRRLLGTAAQLTYLAGFMSFDENRQGSAQSYYQCAAALAAEAGDPQVYATVLRALSVQAYHLGHYVRALDLAESAAREVRILGPGPGAFLMGQFAVAAAGSGDRRAALAHLAWAERCLSRAEDEGTATGYHQAALAAQQAEVRAAGGDRAGAVAALAASMRHRPPAERRARAVTSARLAGLQLDQGHLEAACTVVHTVIDDRQYLDSARVDAALRRLRARLRTYHANPAAAGVLDRLAGPAPRAVSG